MRDNEILKMRGTEDVTQRRTFEGLLVAVLVWMVKVCCGKMNSVLCKNNFPITFNVFQKSES